MKLVIFGATGMVGEGALIEALDDPRVERVLAVTRRPLSRQHDKLDILIHDDFRDYRAVADRLEGFDACLYCLGVSAFGMSEADYAAITHDFTIAAARVLWERNPDLRFIYVSGEGTDRTEQGAAMWARVKGRVENELLAMGPGKAFMFRPAYIQPCKGVRSRTALYQAFYSAMRWLYPVWRAVFPGLVTTTEDLGKAMIAAACGQAHQPILRTREINALAG
ncbi:MAG: epimerase [Deltaproteobacteria bacterium]|nr:MAG: epimerase [Deltaproteobacteria bacterium]